MLERVITEITVKPDVFMQVSVANEFEPKGHYNIGVTAGVETTIAPKDFIDGSNKMDLIIVPSNFTKQNLGGTVYQQKDQAMDSCFLAPLTFCSSFRRFQTNCSGFLLSACCFPRLV